MRQRLQNSKILSIIFSWADDKHQKQHKMADYAGGCSHWRCELFWAIEQWLWYGEHLSHSGSKRSQQNGGNR